MYKPKLKMIGVLGMVLMLLAASQSFAWRPPDPQPGLMGFNPDGGLYVPQDVGIYDKYYCQFDEPECRACHGANTASRHHSTHWYYEGDCLHCHTVIPGPDVEPERNCKVCHTGTTPLGGGGPHHATYLADSDQCTQCHNPNLLVETWTVPPPSYVPDENVMPRPWTCENCHWPKVAPMGLPDDIQANGPVLMCPLGGANPALPLVQRYLPADGTHHEVDEKVYAGKCINCHSSSPEHDPDFTCEGDPSGMHLYLIRYCENCHSEDSLHGISEHVTAGHGMSANEKCVACHGSYPSAAPEYPTLGPELLDIDYFHPGNDGSSGEIITIRGNYFGEYNSAGDWVKIGKQNPPPPFAPIWVECAIFSWADQQIEVKVPSSYGTGLAAGYTYKIKVHKKPMPAISYPGGTTAAKSFTINPHPEILGLSTPYGVYGTSFTIFSVGMTFGTQVESIPTADSGSGATANPAGDDTLTDGTKGWIPNQWAGYHVTVEGERDATNAVYPREIKSNTATVLTIDGDWNHAVGAGKKYIIAAGKQKYVYGECYWVKAEAENDDYRMGRFRRHTAAPGPEWGPDQIKTKWTKWYDMRDNCEVPPEQYYVGEWNLYVVHEYFIDDGDGMHLNVARYGAALPDPTKPAGWIDPGDKCINPHVPDPDQLQNWYYREISDPPYVFNIIAEPYINCLRPNRGPAGTLIKVIGANFGTSQESRILRYGAKAMYAGHPKIKLWTNTKIKFKAPNRKTCNKKYNVFIIDKDGTLSNKKKFLLKCQ